MRSALIRRTPLPVTYVDFHAQFPAVSSLLDCREILCAENWEFADFTAGARDDGGTRQPWKIVSAQNSGSKFAGIALVEPCEDVVPIRAKFGQRARFRPNFGMEFSYFKTAILGDGSGRNRRKTDDRKATQNLKAIPGYSARSAVRTDARETLFADGSGSSS